MQDTKNLKRHIKEYESLIDSYRKKGDFYSANFWEAQLGNLKLRIIIRDKNRRKNKKQYRKAN